MTALYYYTGPSYGVLCAPDGRYLFVGRDYVRRGSAGHYPLHPSIEPLHVGADVFDRLWSEST